MTPRFALGLVVGKFAPLHTGHLHLIDHAAAHCERVLVLSWTEPGHPGCTTARREHWLRACRPQHEVCVVDGERLARWRAARGLPAATLPPDDSSDATQQHFLAGLLADVLQHRPDAMFASEAYVEPCAAVLAARFGRPVTPVLVDPARARVPVRARDIRADPLSHRRFLPDEVWADWVPRVCLLGGESSGKTTLAKALADRLGEPWVPEYGRELWERQGGRLDEPDLLHIAQEQVSRERKAARAARRVLVCDTSPLTTLFYAQAMFGRADPALDALAGRPYALHLLCEPDFPFVQDGTRQGDAFRRRQHAWYLREAAARGLPLLRMCGTPDRRVAQVLRALGLPDAPAG